MQTTEPRAIKSGTRVTLTDGRDAAVIGFVANDQVTVIINGSSKREVIAYTDINIASVPQGALLDCSPAEMKRRAFDDEEAVFAAKYAAVGKTYPGRAALFPRDPYRTGSTETPWWF